MKYQEGRLLGIWGIKAIWAREGVGSPALAIDVDQLSKTRKGTHASYICSSSPYGPVQELQAPFENPKKPAEGNATEVFPKGRA